MGGIQVGAAGHLPRAQWGGARRGRIGRGGAAVGPSPQSVLRCGRFTRVDPVWHSVWHPGSSKTRDGGETDGDRVSVTMVLWVCLDGLQVLPAIGDLGRQPGWSKTMLRHQSAVSLPSSVGPQPACGLPPRTAGRGCCGAPDQPAARQAGHSASGGSAQLVPGNTANSRAIHNSWT